MIVEARLIKQKSTNGLWEAWEHVPLGRVYRISPASRVIREFLHFQTGTMHKAEVVMACGHGDAGYIPTELLDWEGK
jgi:hypothetical protein